MEPTAWTGVYRHGRDLYTVNSQPGHRVYGEDLRQEGSTEYRRWDPFRSKLAALLLKGPKHLSFAGVRGMLYLGAAHGTTASHLVDVLPTARIFAIEKSPAAFPTLLEVVRRRPTLLPIFADAQLPERYVADVGLVDLLYQDVAQRSQARIFVENATTCLKRSGQGVFMLKIRSVTQAKAPRQILAETRREIEEQGLSVVESVDLNPFARDHVALLVRP